MQLMDAVNARYATKKFDPKRTLDADTVAQIKALLRYCPSGINLQPWHFILGQSDGAKARIGDTFLERYAINREKVVDASMVVVFCARARIDEDYIRQLLDQEDVDGRLIREGDYDKQFAKRMALSEMHRYERKDLQHWVEKQVYLNMGHLLLGVAMLGVDAVALEGVDMQALDAAFDLRRQGLTAVAVVALGYRADDDYNAALPKSRLPESVIFTDLDA